MALRTHETVLVRIALAGLAGLAMTMPAAAQNSSTGVGTTGTVLELERNAGTLSRAELDLPQPGTATMQDILARYGQPVRKYPAVGDPPITRWDYGSFSIYFEYNLFLNAVVPSDPVPVVHRDQLIRGTSG